METVKVMRRYNTGNYEFIEIEMIAPVEEGVCRTTMANILHTDIKQVFADKDLKIEKVDKDQTKMKLEEKKPAVKPNRELKEELVDGTKEEAKEKPTKKTTKKKVTTKKPKKSACVPYDREQQAHKDDFAIILNDRCEGWKTAEGKKQAKATSVALSGVEMFGPDGNILDEFAEKVYDMMSSVLETEL